MTFGAPPSTGPLPRRGRQLIPASLPRRGEVVAACGLTIVAGHLVLAPVTLVVAIVLAAAGRATRWSLWWLLCPAAMGLAWVVAMRPGAALARFTAWPSGILGPLTDGHRTVQPGHPLAAFHLAWSSLPGQLPGALICGAAEAAVLGWLYWLHTHEWSLPPRRAGLLSLLRGRLAGTAIRAGAVLTRDGCALGVARANGATAELRWAEMAGGLLITGDDSRDVTLASLQVVHAALRRRKPLIVFDHGDGSTIGHSLTAACLATGVPLRTNGPAAGDASTPGGGRSADGGSASELWGRSRGGLREGSRSRGTAHTVVDPDEVILARSAALLPADSAVAAARACADLAALAHRLRAIGVDGDGLVWIPRGDLVPAADLAVLLRDAPAAGLQVLIGATSPAAAADLAGLVAAALILRVTDPALASRLADLTGVRMLPVPAATAIAGPAGAAAAPSTLAGMPAMPAVPPPPPAVLHGASGARLAAPPQPPAPAVSGVPAVPHVSAGPGPDLTRCPVVSPRTLQALRRREFVLAANVPRSRLIALGRLIPARLPRRAEPLRLAEPRYLDESLRRAEPPPWRAPEEGGR